MKNHSHVTKNTTGMPLDISLLASILDGVRWIGEDRLVARCPGHDDRSPSLSVREGERGILLKDWSGCSLDEICAALGIEVSELFYDSGMTSAQRRALPPRPRRFDWRRMSSALGFASESHWLRAQAIFKAARQCDVSTMADEDLDQAWKCLGIGFHSLRVSANLGITACQIRVNGLALERTRHASRALARQNGRAAA